MPCNRRESAAPPSQRQKQRRGAVAPRPIRHQRNIESSVPSRPPDRAGGESGCELLSLQPPLAAKGCEALSFSATTVAAEGSPATARAIASFVAW